MSNRRPEHYVGAKETHYLICNENGHLAMVLAKMEAWQRYVDRDPHRDGWFWMSARQMSKQMMAIVGRSNANKYMNQLVDMGLVEKQATDDPQEPTKWTVDMDKLAELRSKYADENGYVDAGVGEKQTLSVGSDTPSVGSDTTKSPNNDNTTTKRTRAETTTPPTPYDTEPVDTHGRDRVGEADEFDQPAFLQAWEDLHGERLLTFSQYGNDPQRQKALNHIRTHWTADEVRTAFKHTKGKDRPWAYFLRMLEIIASGEYDDGSDRDTESIVEKWKSQGVK